MSYYTDFAQGLSGLSDIELDDLFDQMSSYVTDDITSSSEDDGSRPSSEGPFSVPLGSSS